MTEVIEPQVMFN